MRALHIVLVDLAADPPPFELLRHETDDVASTERIENEIARLSQKTYEETRNRWDKACRVDRKALSFTRLEVRVGAVSVGSNDQVGRNGSTIVSAPLLRNHVLRRPRPRVIPVLE